MKEFYVYEQCCSCVGSFRIEDANQLPILNAEGHCCMCVDDFSIVDYQGYEIARIQQDSCWSLYNYSIYRDDTKIASLHREFTCCRKKFHLHSERGHYAITGMMCDNRYRVERGGDTLVALITRPFCCTLACNRRVLVQMRDDEDALLLLCAAIVVCRILRRRAKRNNN